MRLVSLVIGVLLVAIFGLKLDTSTLCNNNILHNASRDFIHAEPYHLLVNLFGLYYVSALEEKIGSAKYSILVVSLILLSSLITFIARKMFDIKCSIGFSGVILGLLSYMLLDSSKDNSSLYPILYLIAISIYPTSKNISVSGHLIGIFSGIIAYFISIS